ncbi:MAG: AAA family ATPase, partial [Gemmatimonadaceae bacterium]
MICPVLVGREGALEVTRSVLDRARDGAGGILLIAGEAGIGKSRLLRETVASARQRGFVVLRGACFEADRNAPLAPVLDLVREYSATTSRATALHVFASAAAELVGVFPELASTFTELPLLESLDPQQERRRLFHAIEETIIKLGRTQPVLIAIEDVHWGDEASLELFLHLARRISEQPVAMVLSFRSDEVGAPLERLLAELDRTRIATELNLSRFSSDEIETMLAAIFDGGTPGGGFAETMHGLTEGNPFFVEEVLKSLLSTGEVSRRADGTWQARPIGNIQAPRTAVEAVRRRLSALSVPARDVASVAAVAGRRFDFALLQSLTGQDERELLNHIRELISAQLVTEESPDRFAFRHALTREAIVGELLARERAALHRSVADALERKGGPI